MLAISGMSNANTYRRVWEKDGRYFVKMNGEIRDVTFAKSSFIRD